MQKILFVTNAMQLNTGSLDFAIYIAKMTQSKLAGVFLNQLRYQDTPQIKQFEGGIYVESVLQENEQTEEQKEAMARAIELFKAYCVQNDIAGTVHLDKGSPIDEAVAESRFADLIIIDPATTFTADSKAIPTKFVKDLLMRSECPVIVAPEKFVQIDEVVFAYDGSGSSVFAIKQFSYLLPQFVVKQVTLLHIKETDVERPRDNDKIEEWLRIHYPTVIHQLASGNASEELYKNYWGQSNKLIVMGAFGRSKLSTLFERSTAEKLLNAVDTPVFISHL